MKLNLMAVVSGLMLLSLAACSNTNMKSYPVNRITSGIELMPLNRNEYKVLGDTQGEACSKYLLGGKLPWFSGVPAKRVSSAEGGGGSFLASLPIIGVLLFDKP